MRADAISTLNPLLWRRFAIVALCILATISAHAQAGPKAVYVGSAACERCHAADYNGWKQTRMANVVRDPKEHPEALLGDFTHPNPIVTFDLGDVAFVYGSRWKQRYFTRRGDDYFVLPAQWDVKKAKWLPFHVEKGTDWWVPFYGESNFDRPTGPLCDGCHSVSYTHLMGTGGAVSEINVTPLIDVLLVLLIIFMVIVPVTPKGLDALVPQPPKPNQPDVPNDRTIVVQLTSNGAGEPGYKINDQDFAKAAVEPKLAEIFATRVEKVMFVKGDANLDFGKVAEVIGFGHSADVTNIGIITPQVAAGH